jgi:PAS domain S-box-containing protein
MSNEESRRTSERYYQCIVDTASEGIWIVDAEDRTVFMNQRAGAMFGYRVEEILGKSPLEFIEGEAAEQVRQGLQRRRRGHSDRYEVCLQRRNGDELWVLISGAPLYDEENRYCGTLAMVTDVTALKRTERETLLAKQEAEAASRAKSDFMAYVSHELRSGMTGILGYAELLLRDTPLESDLHQHAETIHRGGLLLLDVVNEMLDWSAIEAGRLPLYPTECSPASILEEVVGLLRQQAAEKCLALDARCEGALPETVHTDPRRLRQILVNLVGNAIKYTTHGSVCTVLRCAAAPEGARRLEIEVRDTGSGLTSEELAKLFTPYVRLGGAMASDVPGTGLGLVISQRLAQLLGGEIRVSSTPGQGTCFTLTIPWETSEAIAAPRGPSLRPEGPPSPTPSGLIRLPRQVLVIEDQPEVRKLLRLVLKRAGLVVHLAENGSVGYERIVSAEETGRPYGAVLLDMHMPGPDGYETVRRLRRENRRVPIVALTASAAPGDREKCLLAGCDRYLAKPVKTQELLAILGEYLPASKETDEPRAKPNDPESVESCLVESDYLTCQQRCQLIKDFLARLHQLAADLDAAESRRDESQVLELAHQIAGASAFYGLPRLASLARQVECVAGQASHPELETLVKELVGHCRRVTERR